MNHKPADNDDQPPLDQKGRDREIEAEALKSREGLDDIPEPGSDPLHEGP
jgi:hypothetical protein